jgi:hypothetical protein
MDAPEARRGLTRRRLLLGGAALAAGGGGAAAAVVVARDGSGSGSAARAGASEGTSAGGGAGGGTSASGGAGGGAGAGTSAGPPLAPVALGAQPAGLPARQFAWNDTLTVDRFGNVLSPRHQRLLFFDVVGRPSAGHTTLLEAALRSLERRFAWGPEGLLFTVGWGPRYFTRTLGRQTSPIEPARALSDFELPAIDDYDMVLHLAGDDETRLRDVENALTHGAAVDGLDGVVDVSRALAWRDTRTGFVGAGLPAAHQNVGGIPAGRPVAPDAPMFMGFRSNLKRNQATEDDVAISSGPLTDATTMAVSHMRLSLDGWYQDLGPEGRVARMYDPQMTEAQVRRIRTDAEGDPKEIGQAIRRYGVVGHSQASARARRGGRAIILRRDFDTVDGGQAGLHFVCLQRRIADFVTTRTAMNASGAQLQNPAITDTVNNGINEFIFVLRRGNYLVPRRGQRSFPMLKVT